MESPAPVEEMPVVEATNKPRPIITKMVLENFKSYAGVKEIGPFHKVHCRHDPHIIAETQLQPA